MGKGEFTPSPRIAELWRYPVKSLLGERLPSLSLVGDGVDGDRLGAFWTAAMAGFSPRGANRACCSQSRASGLTMSR